MKLKCTYKRRERGLFFTAGRKQNVTSHICTANKRTIYHQALKFLCLVWDGWLAEHRAAATAAGLLYKCLQKVSEWDRSRVTGSVPLC